MAKTVFSVANHILMSGKDKNFDLLQLIKLCYLSYGWYLTYYQKPLFNEKVEAWKYGPVIPELYYALKHFRDNKLPTNCLNSLAQDEPLSTNAKQLIEAVTDFYGQYSGLKLSALTHKKGSPWHETYKRIGTDWKQIPDKTIKKHFDNLRENLNS